MLNPTELAMLPATEGHIERAKEAVRVCSSMEHELNVLLASNPTRGQMVDFMEALRMASTAEQLAATHSDQSLAHQLTVLQEENFRLRNQVAALQRNTEPTSNSDLFEAMGASMIRMFS